MQNVVEHAPEVKQVQSVEKAVEKKVEVDMDGPTLRRLIAVGLSSPSRTTKSVSALSEYFLPFNEEHSLIWMRTAFDEILTDYTPRSLPSSSSADSSVSSPPKAKKDSFDSFLSM